MEQKEVELNEAQDSGNIHAQLAASLDKMGSVEAGENVTGTIAAVTNDTVYVSIEGLGRDGELRLSEFGHETPKVGDRITVYLKNSAGRNGLPEMSKMIADEKRLWDELCDEKHKECRDYRLAEQDGEFVGYRIW